MSEHTPGPWGYPNNTVVVMGLSWLVFANYESAEARANARLITAAPDMLGALKFCLGQDISPECSSMVRAAINKAEGKP